MALWRERAYMLISISPPLCQWRSSGWADPWGGKAKVGILGHTISLYGRSAEGVHVGYLDQSSPGNSNHFPFKKY